LSRVSGVKAAIQSVLHALWLGWMRHSFPLLHDPRVAELEDEVVNLRYAAIRARGIAAHAEFNATYYRSAAETSAELASAHRQEALEQEERADRAEELLVEVRSTLHAVPASAVTTGDVVDAIELIDNHMNEREAK